MLAKIKTKKNEVIANSFLILLFLILPLINSTKVIDPVSNLRLLVLCIIVLILVVSLFLKSKRNSSMKFIKHPFFSINILYILFSAISIIKALSFGDAIFELVKLFLLFSFLFIITNMFANDTKIREVIVKLITISALILITIYFFQLIKFDSINNPSTLTNKNLFSSALFLMLPFVSFGIILLRKTWRRLGLISIGGILICIFLLQTRSVWLAIIISSITILLVSLHFLKSKKSSLLFETLKKKTTFISIFLLFLIIMSLLITALFTEKSGNTLLGRTHSIQARFFLWKATVKVIPSNLFTGVGIGNWKNYILSVGNENFTDDAFTETFYQRPHNDYLWIFSEIGLFGFVLYLLLFVSIIFCIFQYLKKTSSEINFLFLLLMLFGIIGYLVIAFFSFPKERIFHQVLLHIIFFFVLSADNESTEMKKKVSYKSVFLICMVIFVQITFSLWVIFKRMNAEIHTKQALMARTNKNWTEVINNINKASTVYYEIDPTSTPLMWYKGEAEYLLGNIQTALSDFIFAYKISPYHLHIMNNLGTCYELVGDHESAISIYKKAIILYPRFNDTIVNLAIVYYNLEQYEMAYNTIMRSTEVDTNPKIKKYKKIIKEKFQKEEL
jgi:O-antigen ligase